MNGGLSHLIIGTAGHVDHGKTVLVKALTGQDTDRLPEEKKRGISIDLGFAEFVLPGGRRVGVVDVPGHERFIRNMVAGVSGIDLVMLVVAADEGVMPQTGEHLDILQLLGVRRGLVVLSKIDLVDGEWLELVEDEVAARLAGTFLAAAPMMRVSARNGVGLDQLRTTLDQLLADLPGRPAGSLTRIPVDRVFTVAGFGTVVTGTLMGGAIRVDDRLRLEPAGLDVRVRQLQIHSRSVPEATAGQRVAVNVAGVDKDEVTRGEVLISPGSLRPTHSFAASLEILGGVPEPLENGERVRLHTGTSEVIGRVLLLEGEQLPPGGAGFMLFKAEKPLVVDRGDRYIIRTYSPMKTIGGGIILDAGRRYRRFDRRGLEELAIKATGDPARIVLGILDSQPMRPAVVEELSRRAGIPRDDLRPVLRQLEGAGELLLLGEGEAVLSAGGYLRLRETMAEVVSAYHQQYPLRLGIPREELRRRLARHTDPKVFAHLLRRLEQDGVIELRHDLAAIAGFRVNPGEEHAAAARRLLAVYDQGGLSPLEVGQAMTVLDMSPADAAEVLRYLTDSGSLVKITEDLYLHRRWLEEARERIVGFLSAQPGATVAELRDVLGTTRKYAVPVLEYFDQTKVTQRVGDQRRLWASP